MKPVNFDGSVILGAPENWDEAKSGPCHGLPVAPYDGGRYSQWRPSWREWFGTLFGKPVLLFIHGVYHPPVHVEVQ